MKKSIIEATEVVDLCTLLQKNKALETERKVMTNIGFISSCVVVGAPGPRGGEDAWVITNTDPCSSLCLQCH